MDVEAVRSMFTSMPVDFVAAVIFATVITVITLRTGASLPIAFSLGLIIATVIFNALPGTFMIGSAVTGITSVFVLSGIFGAIWLVLSFILYRMTSTLSDDSARPLFAIATGLATAVVVLTMWHITPLQNLWTFNSLIQGAFGEMYRVYWLILAFVAFAFVKS